MRFLCLSLWVPKYSWPIEKSPSMVTVKQWKNYLIVVGY
uniref:Uncharacterized protein n=1 Tax=Rhizophora mucronata TaxID=61149 RepID=A0A2P2N7L3_RHIMU